MDERSRPEGRTLQSGPGRAGPRLAALRKAGPSGPGGGGAGVPVRGGAPWQELRARYTPRVLPHCAALARSDAGVVKAAPRPTFARAVDRSLVTVGGRRAR